MTKKGYEVLVYESAERELDRLRAYDAQQVMDAMAEQLTHQPTVETRNRKPLVGLAADFEHVTPVWELRVGEFRVFYDVEEAVRTVHVRAVRRKGPDKTTKEIT